MRRVWWTALLVTSVVASARAEPSGAHPVEVTAFPLAHPGLEEAALLPVMRALDEGLRRNPRLEMKTLDARLADFAQAVPQQEIDAGRARLKRAQKALQRHDLATAMAEAESAMETLSRLLPYIRKQELADAMVVLSAAQLEAERVREAKRTLTRLLVWRDDYKIDPEHQTPRLLALLEQARQEVARARRGSIEIDSVPRAAQVFVDGRYRGATPCSVEGLVVGEHWVTLKREGYQKAGAAAPVSAHRQNVVKLTLERASKYLLIEQALAALEAPMGADQLPPLAKDLADVLFIDHAVFVRVTQPTPGQLGVAAFLYDLRTQLRLARVTRTVPVVGAERALGTLAASLYATVINYDARRVEPQDPPPAPAPRRSPFYKSWWFWSAAGVALGGAVLGGVLGARLLPKDCGASNTCYSVTF